MSSQLSEVINYLSFDGVVNAGTVYSTISVILQEYGSICIKVVSDQNVKLVLSFSDDNQNFDYNLNTIVGTGFTPIITSLILGKWCRISINNSSSNNANIRFSSFCQTIPISVQPQITSDTQRFPSVNIDNFTESLYGLQLTAEQKIIHDHKFIYDSIVGGEVVGSDRDFKTYRGGGILSTSTPNINGNVLKLADIFKSPIGAYLAVGGPPVIYRSGNPILTTFSALFDISGYDTPAINGYDCSLIGMGYQENGSIIDGVFLGYPSGPVAPDTIINEICLVYYNNGVETYIKRSDWSFDSLDGSGPSKINIDPQNLSVWRLRVAYHGTSSIYLEYHKPYDNEFQPCHRFVYENLYKTANFKSPSFSYMMFTKRTTTASGSGFYVVGPGSASGQVGVEIGGSALGQVQNYGIDSNIKTIVAASESNILSIRAGPLINSINNRAGLKLIHISFSCDGTKNCTFKMYKNGTFASPTWVYLDSQRSPAQILTTGSIITPSGYLVTGHFVGKTASNDLDLSVFDLWLYKDDTFSITCTSAGSSDVQVFLTYSLID